MKITNLSVCENGEEEEEEDEGEEYIEMEVSSSPSVLHCCTSPQSREFEFQMCAASGHPPTTASPADHLFHKGRLLPLCLLHPAPAADDSFYSLPFAALSATTTAAATPLDSCNISPSESRRVSCDLNSDDFFFEWSSELKTFIHHHPAKIPWPKKLNLIRNSTIAQKLRASRNYLKSLFVKSTCSLDSSAKPQNPSHGGEISHKLLKNSKRKTLERDETAPYPTIAAIINNIEKDGAGAEDNNTVQRRSFSSAIKRHSPTKCLSSSSSNSSSGSSSFSLNSNGGLHEVHCLRRSSSATEIEGSIEAAIAHCKKSQQIFESRIN